VAAVARLILQDFRSYPALDLAIEGQIIALVGSRTAPARQTILEALSLFAPGRGLRRVDLADMARQGGPGGFAASITLADDGARLGMG
jgi:DNA replication and repair protein RecF